MSVDDHSIEFINKNIEDIKSELKVIKVDIESRVKYQHFTWVLGLLMTIVIGLLSVIYLQVKEFSAKSTREFEVQSESLNLLKQQVGLIQYRLDSAEITK